MTAGDDARLVELDRNLRELRDDFKDFKRQQGVDWRQFQKDIKDEIKELKEELDKLRQARVGGIPNLATSAQQIAYVLMGTAGIGWLIVELLIKRGGE